MFFFSIKVKHLGNVIHRGKLEVVHAHTTSLRKAGPSELQVNLLLSWVCVTSTDSSYQNLQVLHICYINPSLKEHGKVQTRRISTEIIHKTHSKSLSNTSFGSNQTKPTIFGRYRCFTVLNLLLPL